MSDEAAADRRYMALALQLARRGLYSTDPNPRVGCVLVKEDRIIGSGWHRSAGEQHAEVIALESASEDPAGATAYVTLEPCNFVGRTGPCSKALVAAGISRAVVAMEDPHPRVAGRGVAELRRAGIEVVMPLMEEEAAALNPGFLKRYRHGLPYVHCKLAMSLDGRTALGNGVSRWVSGPDARADVQKLRARCSAIVTGIGTVLLDDPEMTLRAAELDVDDVEIALANPPMKVVLDSQLRIDPGARILRPPGRAMVVAREVDSDKVAILQRDGVEVVIQPGGAGRIDLQRLLAELADLECNEVLVEAGATLAGAFIDSGLVDELVIYVAPKLFGDRGRPLLNLPEFTSMGETLELTIREIRQVGEDLRITAAINNR